MTKPISHHSVSEIDEGESSVTAGLKNLTNNTSQKKALVIDYKDLKIIMDATGLQRTPAIDLIQKTNGDIKAALELYVNQ